MQGMQLLLTLKNHLFSFLKDERAQDALEYILVVGGVTVAVIRALALAAPGLINAVIDGVCVALEEIEFIDLGDCTPA